MTAVVAKFWLAQGSRHVSLLIRDSWRSITGYSKQIFSLDITRPFLRMHLLPRTSARRGHFLASRASADCYNSDIWNHWITSR